MLFSQFIVDRLQLLNRASCGYGNQISERSLYEALLPTLDDPADFASLISWGLVTGLLGEIKTNQGRRFSIDRAALASWRSRANGEPTLAGEISAGPITAATSFNKIDPTSLRPHDQTPPGKPGG